MTFLLCLLSALLVVYAAGVDTISSLIEEEIGSTKGNNLRSSRRSLRIVDEEEFSKYRQEPLTIPPPPSHASSAKYMNSNVESEQSEISDVELEPQLHRNQHHRQGYSHGHGYGRAHGHKQEGYPYQHGIGVGTQHFDAELNNDVSSFHHLDHASDVDSVPMKPRKFRPHFSLDESSAHGARMKIHPRHRHHPIKASFDEFDGHTGEYVRSGHITSVSSITNVLPS